MNYLTNRIERQQCFGRIDWPGFKSNKLANMRVLWNKCMSVTVSLEKKGEGIEVDM